MAALPGGEASTASTAVLTHRLRSVFFPKTYQAQSHRQRSAQTNRQPQPSKRIKFTCVACHRRRNSTSTSALLEQFIKTDFQIERGAPALLSHKVNQQRTTGADVELMLKL
jgi:hypothetical protein